MKCQGMLIDPTLLVWARWYRLHVWELYSTATVDVQILGGDSVATNANTIGHVEKAKSIVKSPVDLSTPAPRTLVKRE